MEKYIKYKRIVKEFYWDKTFKFNTQEFFDELITDGWEIIYYDEKENKSDNPETSPKLKLVVVVGKKQNNLL